MTEETWADKQIDSYLESPIKYDIVIVCLLLAIEYVIELLWFSQGWPTIKILSRTDVLSFISSIISGAIALAGFMVAALTIFISVKASLKVRGIEDAENALDIIFSTGHYQSIINVFKHSIIELIALFIVLYFGWIYSANFSELVMFKLALSSVFIIVLSMARSLYILFEVLGLENLKKEK